MRLLRTESAPRHGFNSEIVRRLLFSVARNLGQSVTYKTLISDMQDGALDAGGPSQETVAAYCSMLREMYILEEVPGWVPPARSPKRTTVKPKRYLADPSLAIATLGMDGSGLLQDWQTFGLVFENLCMRDLLVYANAMQNVGDVPVRYYRDDSGLEADAVIELADGRWAAIEVKTSEEKVPEAVTNLKRLRAKLCENARARTRPPEFMMALTGVSEYAREAEKDIYAVPVRCLGA